MTMSEDRSLDQVTSLTPEIIQLGVDGGTTLYAGSFAAPLTATGMLAVGGGVASTNAVMGIASAQADNSAGSDGELSVNLAQGVFRRVNSSTSPCVAATAGKVVYAEDGETVRIASGATYPVAGVFLGFEADGTTPLVFCSAVLNYLLSQGTLESNLAATTSGLGASKIGVYDVATNFAGTDVEAVLAEIIATYALTTNGNGASMIGIEDSGAIFTATDVEAALAEAKALIDTAYAGRIQHRQLVVAESDLTAAAATETLNVGAVLPANATVLATTLYTYTPFTGGTISDFTVDIGVAGDADCLVDGADLFTAAVDGAPATVTAGVNPNKTFVAAGQQITAKFDCGSDDVADATAGAVTIDVAFVVLQ